MEIFRRETFYILKLNSLDEEVRAKIGAGNSFGMFEGASRFESGAAVISSRNPIGRARLLKGQPEQHGPDDAEDAPHQGYPESDVAEPESYARKSIGLSDSARIAAASATGIKRRSLPPLPWARASAVSGQAIGSGRPSGTSAGLFEGRNVGLFKRPKLLTDPDMELIRRPGLEGCLQRTIADADDLPVAGVVSI